jgi:predicted nucleic acid-binding protein
VAAFFFDTSALVKRHVTEVGSSWVRVQTAAKAGHTLYIAGITAMEVTSAITRRQRGRSLSAAQARAIYGHFRRHLAQRYVVLEITPALMAGAMLLARSHGLRAYDAFSFQRLSTSSVTIARRASRRSRWCRRIRRSMTPLQRKVWPSKIQARIPDERRSPGYRIPAALL